ncbi:hypothetical protein QLH51_12890 [Sphingomonas sp. 2R-10]|uniref:hypothetical protein n=1 Tax=Sphingomonas sp. 2R-10 TaxID=3045148 RepID=UPI000F7AFF81|nr:hypothetical protein [Sphingomonas sp. 2R-10]MDJ0277694.1 hypothetical protein [Sphingomonas sp. 2R-10]
MQITSATFPKSYGSVGIGTGSNIGATRVASDTPAASSTPSSVPVSKAAGQAAREKLDADYAKAASQGTRIVADTANGGRHLDVSSLTDEELAAAAKGDGFSSDESLTAKAALAGRMWATLAPFEGNPRGSAAAVKSLFPALSPAVRSALGWTEATLTGSDAVIRNFGGAPKESEQDTILEKLRKSLQSPGALKFDASLLAVRGGTVDLTA